MPSLPPRTPLAALLLVGALAGAARPAAAQSLRGSPASVDRMYVRAQDEGLSFSETAADVHGAVRDGALVRIVPGTNVALRSVTFPFAIPAARTFVERLGAEYRDACRKPLTVTSAARPTTRQPRNSVAESVHPTGMAIDLHKPSGKCLRWLRATLLEMEGDGVIEATEEFHPAHFHVAVFPTAYARYAAARGDAPVRATPVRVATSAPATPAATRATSSRPARATTSKAKPSRAVATRTAPARSARDTYRVRVGDTLWDIARAHDVSVRELRAANGLARSAIRPGQTLRIPADAGGAAATAEDAGES